MYPVIALALVREIPVIINDPSSFLQRLWSVSMELVARLKNFFLSLPVFTNFSVFSKESWKAMAIFFLVCSLLLYYSSSIIGALIFWCINHFVAIATLGALFVQFCNGSYVSITILVGYLGYLYAVYSLKLFPL